MNNKTNTLQLPLAVEVAAGKTARVVTRARGHAMSLLSQQYRALTADQKAQWNLANHQMQTPDNPQHSQTRGENGWTAFYANNVLLYKTGLPLVSTPGTILVPASLPILSAEIALANASQTAEITLVPQSSDPYPAGPMLAVWATPATPLGNGSASPTAFRAKAYFFVGTFDGGLPLSGLNVTSAYLSLFASVPASCRIAFKVVALCGNGCHSAPAYTFGESPMLSALAAEQGSEPRAGSLRVG